MHTESQSMRYVLTLITRNHIDNDFELIIVEKDKPKWQIGRWNLPGGKIEEVEGENPMEAAFRETEEETGIYARSCAKKGMIRGGDCPDKGDGFAIHCFHMGDIDNYDLKPQESETQKVFWAKWSEVKDNERLMPNLRVAIPLMVLDSNEWIITDNSPSWTSERHSFTIEVPSTTKIFG